MWGMCMCACRSPLACPSHQWIPIDQRVSAHCEATAESRSNLRSARGTLLRHEKQKKRERKNPYAFSCFLSSSFSCRCFFASLGSAGRCRRCHGNGGGLTVGRGGGDVTASVPVTWQPDGGLGGDLCTAAGEERREMDVERRGGREMGEEKGGRLGGWGGGGEREGIESKRIRGIEEKEEGTRRVGKVLNEGRGGNYNSGRALFCLQHLCHSLLLSLPSPAHMPFFFLLCLLHHPPNHHLLLYPPRLPNQSLSSFCGHQSPPANPKLLLRSTVIRPTSRH